MANYSREVITMNLGDVKRVLDVEPLAQPVVVDAPEPVPVLTPA